MIDALVDRFGPRRLILGSAALFDVRGASLRETEDGRGRRAVDITRIARDKSLPVREVLDQARADARRQLGF